MVDFPSDNELIERLQKNDIEAFDLIYKKYSGKIYRFGLKYLRVSFDAEGLVQSVFLKIWENRRIIRKGPSFYSYLFTIAYNDICKTFRERSYLRKFIVDTLSENPHYSYKIEDNIDYQSFLERVHRIIDTLPERQKTIFKMSREEGKTTKEIAKELDLSTGTIDNYMSASIRFIRNHLKNENLTMMFFFFLYCL